MKRSHLLLLVILVMPILAITVSSFLPWETAITLENAHRIKPGMTRAEVEAILGPPRNEATGGYGIQGSKTYTKGGLNPVVTDLEWYSNAACIWIGFDKRDKVVWTVKRPMGTETRWEGFQRQVKAAVRWQ